VSVEPAAPLRLLVTGANGQVGWHLQRTLGPLGDVEALGRGELELTDLKAVRAAVRELQPDVVVNAAAYTAVDKAESESELAHLINAEAPGAMASECAAIGALLVHYSTDYVYDGSKTAPYDESDAAGPLGVYGATKLEGDKAIVASGCPHIILRTTWVYDIRGKNFLRTVLRLAREKDELRMVGDQFGAPTWARSIAEATALILARALQQRGAGGAWPVGLFHLTAAGETSWAGFAQAILEDYDAILDWPAETSEFGGELRARRVVEITTAQYKTAARRPRNSVLSNARIQAAFGITMPDWRDQLRLALQDAIR
jgi:dTDP-4-dehydrorhamnose reductase